MVDLGDRHHEIAGWISQYEHHSKAPLTDVPAAILRNAYVYCQQHARLCICQSYGYDTQDPIGDSTNAQRTWVAADTSEYIGIARGYRTIPNHFNRVSAQIHYAVYDFAQTEVDHQIRVIDGSANEDSQVSTTYVSAVQDSLASATDGKITTSQNHMQELLAAYPFTSGFRTHTAAVEVFLSDIDETGPGLCEIIVEARANGYKSAADYDNPVPYRPLFVAVTLKVGY